MFKGEFCYPIVSSLCKRSQRCAALLYAEQVEIFIKKHCDRESGKSIVYPTVYVVTTGFGPPRYFDQFCPWKVNYSKQCTMMKSTLCKQDHGVQMQSVLASGTVYKTLVLVSWLYSILQELFVAFHLSNIRNLIEILLINEF